VDFTTARDDLDAILLDDLVSSLAPKAIALEDLRAVDVSTCDVLSGYLLSFIDFVDLDATTAVVFDAFLTEFTNDRDDRDANSFDDNEAFLADLDATLADLINDRDDRDANSAEDLDTFLVVFDMALDDRDANSAEDLETFLVVFDMALDDRDANSAEDLDTFLVVFDMTLDDRDANSPADNANDLEDLDAIVSPDFFDTSFPCVSNLRGVVASLFSEAIV